MFLPLRPPSMRPLAMLRAMHSTGHVLAVTITSVAKTATWLCLSSGKDHVGNGLKKTPASEVAKTGSKRQCILAFTQSAHIPAARHVRFDTMNRLTTVDTMSNLARSACASRRVRPCACVPSDAAAPQLPEGSTTHKAGVFSLSFLSTVPLRGGAGRNTLRRFMLRTCHTKCLVSHTRSGARRTPRRSPIGHCDLRGCCDLNTSCFL